MEQLVDGDWGCQRCDTSWHDAPVNHPRCHLPGGFIGQTQTPELLESAAATFRERNALYGSNYQREGALLLALFPEGGIPAIADAASANRLHVLVACVTKLQRYAHNFHRGGHRDSAHDLVVYAAMLEEFTDEQISEKANND